MFRLATVVMLGWFLLTLYISNTVHKTVFSSELLALFAK